MGGLITIENVPLFGTVWIAPDGDAQLILNSPVHVSGIAVSVGFQACLTYPSVRDGIVQPSDAILVPPDWACSSRWTPEAVVRSIADAPDESVRLAEIGG